jgi:hypothetical protein
MGLGANPSSNRIISCWNLIVLGGESKMMGDSDTQKLQKINSQLLDLYLKLSQSPLKVDEEQSIRATIISLETGKKDIPISLLVDDKIQQYVIILRSAANSLQLHRQIEHQFADQKDEKLSPDETRQRNINLNKRKSIEKKIDTYRQKLSDMGLRQFELDDIVLEGYREQNLRLSEKLLRSFELTITDYLEELYQNNEVLPKDFFALIQSWEYSLDRTELGYNQLRILELKSACLRKGIPFSDIEKSVQTVTQWDDKKKQSQLRILTAKLQQEIVVLGEDVNIMDEVNEWIQHHQIGKRLKPNQSNIVSLRLFQT